MTADDQHWMRRALSLAATAAEQGEVPVGAVVVREGKVIGEGFNASITYHDPTGHAEIRALRDAAQREGNYRLPDSTLYVTLEPCTMCLGAVIHARVARLVFGAREPRAGAVVSQLRLLDLAHYNHRIEWHEGVLADESSEMLRAFFRSRR